MNRYNLTWSDAGKALMVMLIANLLGLITGLPDDQLPTWVMIKSNLILSLKFAVVPYLIKNFLSDDVKSAQKTLEKAEARQEKKDMQP